MKGKFVIKSIVFILFISTLLVITIASTTEKPIMVFYYGEKLPLQELQNNNTNLSCDDHLGQGILTCYKTFEEMLSANTCTIDSNRDIKCEKVKFDETQSSSEFIPEATLYAVLWQNSNYSGINFACYYDYNDLRSVGFNDRTSSVDIVSTTILYQDIDYQGDTLTLYQDNPDLRNNNFNDKASSVERY